MSPQEFTTLPSLTPDVSHAALEVFGDAVLPEIDSRTSSVCFKTDDSLLVVAFNEQLDPSVVSGLPIIAAYQAGFIARLTASFY